MRTLCRAWSRRSHAPSRVLGEWGFAALLEADGFRVLYDAGYRPETVLRNAEELGVELASVKDVVLSPNHGRHGGFCAHRSPNWTERVPISRPEKAGSLSYTPKSRATKNQAVREYLDSELVTKVFGR